MTEFILATANPRKLAEMQVLLAAYGHTARPCECALPDEGNQSLEANARLKAQAAHLAYPHAWVLGDDSGLFLRGLPDHLGVQTARELPRTETNAALQALMAPLTDRRARLISVLVLASPSGTLISAHGVLEAVVAPEARGDNSRGFDRVLVPEGEALTLAEMSSSMRRGYLPRARALNTLFA